MKEIAECPVRDVLHQIMDAWSVAVLLLLNNGKYRFSEIYRNLPGNISKRMLSKTLRSLEENGLLNRTVFPTKPPSVEYELTHLGQSFMPIVLQLADWAQVNQTQVHEARLNFNRDVDYYAQKL